MNGNETSHLRAFRKRKLKPDETVEAHLSGWVGEMMGSGKNKSHNGQFVLTNERACFYRKGFIGEVFETIPLSKVSAIETLSRLGYRMLRLYTSNDELAFKTFESSTLFDELYARLEALRHHQPGSSFPPAVGAESVTDQLKALGELREAGVLTDGEFATKKVELLSRL